VLTTSWSPLAGAAEDVIEDVKNLLRRKDHRSVNGLQSALEVSRLNPTAVFLCLMAAYKMAIFSRTKRFVASSIVQFVVNDIYSGRVVYSSSANRSIVADTYKLCAIEIYDSRNAAWLNHYRCGPPFRTLLCYCNCYFLHQDYAYRVMVQSLSS